jgi:hypothetical protein
MPTCEACRRSGSPTPACPPVSPHTYRACPGTPALNTIPTAAIRPSAFAPFAPCIRTPVRSADTYPTVLPSASRDHSQSTARPNVSPAANRSPTSTPTRSVTRSTVDSLTRSPHSLGNVRSAASAKLDSTPARATASLAPRLRSPPPSPNRASRGQCPAWQCGQ